MVDFEKIKEKKIAIVINSSWAAYNFRFNLAKYLKAHGFSVVFIAPFDLHYSKIISREFDFHHLDLKPQGLNPFKDIKTLISLYFIFKSANVDIALNFSVKANIYGSIAAWLNNISCVSNISGLGTVFIRKSLSTEIVKIMYRFSLKLNSVVFFQNHADQKLFTRNNLLAAHISQVIPGSGVDINKFKAVKLMPNKSHLKFVFVGRLIADKGIKEYIEAIKVVKKTNLAIEFLILGSTENTNATTISNHQVMEWVDAGIVKYLGASDHVEKVLSDCDCVVLPSYREGLPRSLLEACCMGKPVIATDVPGCSDVVDDGINGFLCSVRDAQDLAQKIIKMATLTFDQRVQMGLNGRRKVLEHFDENLVLKKYLRTVSSILNS